jgi:hypothetical protein
MQEFWHILILNFLITQHLVVGKIENCGFPQLGKLKLHGGPTRFESNSFQNVGQTFQTLDQMR